MENIFVGLIVMIQLLKMVLKKCMKQLVLINLTWFTQIHTGIFFQKIKKIKPGINFAKYFLKNGFLPFTQPSSIWKKNVYKNCGGTKL